ncbi:MAG: hypothetical protein D6772_13065 [Bacteroidetes bacterium]|nr:MAG: hypothetical protein D6772_13065 [Bacteroidota bacterium]
MSEVIDITAEEARVVAEDYRLAKNQHKIVTAQRDAAVSTAQREYVDALTELEKKMEEGFQKLEAYAKQNKSELLGDKRSTDFFGIKLGFRKAKGKLVTKGKNTWEKVLENLQANVVYKTYISTTVSVDKDKLKKADPDILKDLGVTIDQPDNFYVEV